MKLRSSLPAQSSAQTLSYSPIFLPMLGSPTEDACFQFLPSSLPPSLQQALSAPNNRTSHTYHTTNTPQPPKHQVPKYHSETTLPIPNHPPTHPASRIASAPPPVLYTQYHHRKLFRCPSSPPSTRLPGRRTGVRVPPGVFRILDCASGSGWPVATVSLN